MIDEDSVDEGSAAPPHQKAATSATPKDLAEALDAIRASAPSLGTAIDAAKVTPATLADAHDRATSEEPDTGHPQT
ncbi:MAG: hypothetical protein ACRDS0_07065 [Pseudonocardiaceae bacterium]